MGPKDPTQISREVIDHVLGANLDSEILLRECGFTSLLAFLDRGTDTLPRVISYATRMRLLKAIHDWEVDRVRTDGLKTSAMEVLHFLKVHITFALVSPIGSLFGEETVEPNSTNPFKSAVASCINVELRRIYQELYLGSLDTPGEALLITIMGDPKNSIRADQRQHFETIKTEAANARS